MDTNIALNNIRLFQALIPDSFAVYGTALGLLRDGDIISHDKDTDMGIMFKDFKYDMLRRLQVAGFEIVRIFGMPSVGFEIAFYRNGVKTDLMFFYKLDDYLYNCLWDNSCVNGLSDMIVHSYPVEMFGSFYKINEVKCPTKNYIQTVYGDNWQEPITEWNWKTDHHNINNSLKKLIIRKYGNS